MILIALAAGIFVLDDMLKEHVNNTCIQGSSREIFGGRLILRNCHNRGFSCLFPKWKAEQAKVFSAMALGGVCWEFLTWLFCGGKKIAGIGLSMMLGGGANNCAERFKRGAVTDYVSVGTKNKKIRKIVFDFSDVCLMLGGVLWAVSALVPKTKRGTPK